MILADTSVWIDHLRISQIALGRAIADELLLMHPFVIGELAMGSLRNRQRMLTYFLDFGSIAVAADWDVMQLVEERRLYSQGLSFIDAHLLTSCVMHGNCRLLSRDGKLRNAAQELGIAA